MIVWRLKQRVLTVHKGVTDDVEKPEVSLIIIMKQDIRYLL